MFREYIDILGECFEKTFTKMTNCEITDVRVRQDEQSPITYSVASTCGYKDFDSSVEGDFTLGFPDEAMALLVAYSIGEKMGLAPLKQFDETASDLLSEFFKGLSHQAVAN